MTRQDARERIADNLMRLCEHSDGVFRILKDSDDGVSTLEISERLNAPKSSICKTLQKMLEVEIVDYRKRPGNGQTKFFFLTHAARRMRSINALATDRPWIYRPFGASNADSGISQ